MATLRVLGTIEEGPEDVSHGDYHSFNIEEATEIKIENYKKELEEKYKQEYNQ